VSPTSAVQRVPKIRAGGGVVVRRTDDGPQFLLVHRPRYDDWSLPKGKLDDKESYRQGALREIEEETRVVPRAIAALGSVAYETRDRNHKVVRYWLAEAQKIRSFKKNAEVDEIAWLSGKEARKLITYSRDREVLEWGVRLLEKPRASRIFLVRHAHAGKRRDWRGEDRKRPISFKGRVQVAALDDMLTRWPVTRVLTSPYLRCRQTATPIAAALGTRSHVVDALEEYQPPETLARYVAEFEGESVVMCSHGDLISGFVGMIAAEGAEMNGPMRWGKGSVWVLDLNKGRVERGRYWPAPI
jgi:8-oxo-dGTP diphosphatase